MHRERNLQARERKRERMGEARGNDVCIRRVMRKQNGYLHVKVFFLSLFSVPLSLSQCLTHAYTDTVRQSETWNRIRKRKRVCVWSERKTPTHHHVQGSESHGHRQRERRERDKQKEGQKNGRERERDRERITCCRRCSSTTTTAMTTVKAKAEKERQAREKT